MTATGDALTVTDAPEARRYEARDGGTLAGVAAYMRTPDMIAFTHTEVEEAYEGQGVGSALARTALDDARAKGLRVVALCPFIDGWMTRHPEYEDLRYEPASRVVDQRAGQRRKAPDVLGRFLAHEGTA